VKKERLDIITSELKKLEGPIADEVRTALLQGDWFAAASHSERGLFLHGSPWMPLATLLHNEGRDQ
jgi:hypothetical protein